MIRIEAYIGSLLLFTVGSTINITNFRASFSLSIFDHSFPSLFYGRTFISGVVRRQRLVSDIDRAEPRSEVV